LWSKHIEGGAPDPPPKVKKAKVEGDETNRPKTKKEKKAAKAAKKAAKKPVSANDTPLGERKERKKEVEGEEEERKQDAPVEAPHVETGAERLERESKAPAVDSTAAPKKDNKRRKSGETKADTVAPAASVAKATTAPTAAPTPAAPPAPTLTPMQAAMRQKLISARFRHLNQTLYTEPSLKALQLFSRDPQMFEDYHSGFRQQVAVWPSNPVDNFIETIRSRGAIRLPHQKKPFKGKFAKGKKPQPDAADSNDLKSLALPRTQGVCIIADLGCGDARLAQTFVDSGESHSLNLKVLSYDLHSPSPLVTKADISKIPTEDGSVDVAIFCLALMGTNWISFIEEAYRILHWKGELWIAEIKSRFGRGGGKGNVVAHSVGGKRKAAAMKKAEAAKQREGEEVNEQETLAVEVDGAETKSEETDVSAFVDVLRRRGFLLKNEAIVKNGESSIDLSNKMFVKMEFVKAANPTKGKGVPDEEDRPVKEERFKKGKKFVDEEVVEVATDDEAKVLKPCLYKIR
jgi:ribosomal RNA-processing protein 8